MPDGAETPSNPSPTFDSARAAVARWLEHLGAAPLQPLSVEELQAYQSRNVAAGWRLSIQFDDEVQRRFDLLLPPGFPWQPARVALVDRPPFLTWPHVESDGVLCLTSDSLEFDPDDPAGVAAYLLGDAERLVSQLIRGELVESFQDEFLSYWSYAADQKGVPIVSLLHAKPPSRVVKVWRGQGEYVVAETEADLRQWLANRPGNRLSNFKAEDAAFVWLKSPPLPAAYPATGQAFREIVVQAGEQGDQTLLALTRKLPKNLVITLGVETTHGPALAGIVVPAPWKAPFGPADPLTKGFRPGSVPDRVLAARYFGGAKVSRRIVERADPDWVHGRGHDPRAAQLRQKTVAIVGCGSVGGAIAIQLAQAGVGHLILVDPDRLKWPNIGRHVLGATAIDQTKAKALAEKMRTDFPHIQVTAHVADADTFVREQSGKLGNIDLIVSATGDWSADRRVDAWQHAMEDPVPVLYGWLEAHACAGHAVLIGGRPNSLRFGFDRTGLPHFSVTAWGHEGGPHREPGCGAVFQPYGPVELSMANSVIADLALDVLLGVAPDATHRVWVSPRKRLEQAAGMWSEAWSMDPAFRPEGGFIFERTWPTASSDTGQVLAA